MSSYTELESRFRRIGALEEAEGILHWDMSVIMPNGGAGSRAEQLAAMKLTIHELLTDPLLEDLLNDAETQSLDDIWQLANLREMRRRWQHANALDGELVEALSKSSSKCEMIWREARPKNDFAAVSDALSEVLNLVRQKAETKASTLGVSPYEALLDQFEPGTRIVDIDRLFDDLASFLPNFLDDALSRQEAAGEPLKPVGPFDLTAQQKLAAKLMEHVGFDFDHGRLDISLHPFCGGVPDDVRITTRYEEDDFAQSLMGVLHETGHAMYERGLPVEWRLQPVGQARGMALHESQSLLVEMQICRGSEFLTFAAPLMRDAFNGSGAAWAPDNMQRLQARVERGFIRVDADEVTYPAHVILRYRLERALISGEMQISDLPTAWNDGMKELLGIVPETDREGCLQDIHWFDGAFGYFPTYTMGALAAAQIYQAASGADRNIKPAISEGDFGPLMTWLRTNIHGKGSVGTTDEILTEATGLPLGTEAFKSHLKARYLN
ncbi:MAG: carboxypeptidase M32 [Rhodospirillaceae bacterium]|nr:carboxypeptidase M32 [Rhodospirillaceae bacterium]|tara:strand:- start:5923 stop:7410 length:1488 start_codon:yes stop_codon:yes gene_type:complete